MMTSFSSDPNLPGLAFAVNSETVTGALSKTIQNLTDGRWEVEDCRIERFRYREHTRAIIQYDIELRNLSSGKTQRQWASGTLYRGNKAKRLSVELTKGEAMTKLHLDVDDFPRCFHEPEFDLLVQVLPFDRHIPNIGKIARPMPLVLNKLLAEQSRADTYYCDPVRYRPGIGATYCLSNDIEPKAYFKVYRGKTGHNIYQQLKSLSEASKDQRLSFDVALPLAYCEDLDCLSIAPARGTNLEVLINRSHDDAIEGARHAARAIAALHLSSLPTKETRQAEGFLLRANKAANLLGWACPQLSSNLDALIAEIRGRIEDVKPHPTHLDMKTDHIFIKNGRVTFIDLDSYAASDPVFDPAMLLARLDAMPLLGSFSYARIKSFQEVFKDTYFASVPSIWAARLGVNYACAALKVALYFLQHLETDWSAKVELTLGRAWDALDRKEI